jgi:hypothetical protein
MTKRKGRGMAGLIYGMIQSLDDYTEDEKGPAARVRGALFHPSIRLRLACTAPAAGPISTC